VGLGLAGTAGAFAYGRQLFGEAAPAMRDHRVSLPDTMPRLVVARGPEPAANVTAVLQRMGGMRAFVGPDDRVLVKPNIGFDRVPALAATTDPKVVATVVRACREAGAREVWVADCPAILNAATAYETSGIHRAAHEAGATVILPDMSRYLQIAIPGRDGTWPILELFLKADKIINVPVAKHHNHGVITVGMKNWFGAIGRERILLHRGIDLAIVGLAELLRPTLTIVDATRVLMRNGPRGGDLGDVKQADAVAASVDPVAADAWAASQLEIPSGRVGSLPLAEQRGLGTTDWKSVAVQARA
jgi:uncharacterized protein (DUF362 family)